MPEPTSPANVVDELAEEFARRWRAGELPSVEDFAARFPQWADQLRAVLPAVVLMEQLKPHPEGAAVSGPPPGAAGRPDRLGEYRIVREIGRGGMGVVYEAVQDALGRPVALKVLPAHLLTDERSRARFLREAQAAARLHHTNIVPVFGVGEQDGQCFYVMQLINGRGLDRARGAAPPAGLAGLPPREFCRAVARVGGQVADALAYAHAQGILHRDVKPSNLLLDEQGAVWVTDFGVAKVVEGAGLTQSGDLIGTLRYMPPERFAGHSDARGDVYSLAVTLHELLTARPAFPDTTPQHLIRLITEEGPVRPRRLDPEIPTDLETILQKGAARDPAHRYQTAVELAEDLRRFLDDRPIRARRTGPLGRLGRWCRRNPALAAATAAAFLLMIAVTAVSLVASARTAAANREAEEALAAEKTQREHAEGTATLALEALNRTYEHFAPNRLVVSPSAATEEGVELPPQQAVLPPEVVPLLEDLLRTYEQIARSGNEFPRLRAQVAQANHRIGDLRRRLGRFEAAAGAYRSAIDLYTRLLAESGPEAVRVKLARACNELGRTLRALQQFEEAGRMHERAIRTLTDAPGAFADRPECRYELACSYYALGRHDMFLSPPGPPGPRREKGGKRPKPPPWAEGDRPPPGRGPAPSADHPTRRAVTLLERLVEDFQSVPEYRHLLACCYRDLPPGPPGSRQGEAARGRALDLLRQLVADFPGVPDYRLDLCETLARPGRPGAADAGDRLREAITFSADLVARYPTVPDYAAAHARALDRLGMELFRAGQLDEAVECHRKAVAYQVRLVKQYPDVVANALWLGLMERSLGRTLGARGDLSEARARLEAATARVESWWRKDPRLQGLRPFLGMAYRDLAEVHTRGGAAARAQEALHKAQEFERDGGPGPFNPRERGGRRP
jgi:tetratricopeptide (TPR) repeat protein